jgi:NADPH:quinone reductase-like Zn-dependent oxidoreductase
MQTIQFAEYGGPEVLRPADTPVPEPGRGQVRVAVRAAGVNALDWKLRAGAMAQAMPLDLPSTPGMEVAGVVDAVGEGAGHAVGDEVFGWSATGSYAEYALGGVIARKPDGLSWQDAVALPVAGETALRGLDLLGVRDGETLLIHGASGAVGRVATQFALARGARVIGVAGERNHEDLRSLGAEPVVYGDGLVDRVRAISPDGVDAVFDTAGQGALPDSVTLSGGKERVLTIADPAAFELGITFSSGGDGQTPELLTRLADDVVSGRLTVVQGKSFPLAEAAEAHRLSESGHSGGKITLTV